MIGKKLQKALGLAVEELKRTLFPYTTLFRDRKSVV